MTESVHFADGFDLPETIALGLEAPQMAVLAGGAALDWVLLRAVPGTVGMALAVPLAGAIGLLGAGRWAGRPLVTWAGLAVRFWLHPRRGGDIVHAEETAPPGAGVDGSATAASPVQRLSDVDQPAPDGQPAPDDHPAPDDQPPWARWLRGGGALAHPGTSGGTDPVADAGPRPRPLVWTPPPAPRPPHEPDHEPPCAHDEAPTPPGDGLAPPGPVQGGARRSWRRLLGARNGQGAPNANAHPAGAETVVGHPYADGAHVAVDATLTADPPTRGGAPSLNGAPTHGAGTVVEIDRPPLVLLPDPVHPGARASSHDSADAPVEGEPWPGTGDDHELATVLHLGPRLDGHLGEELMLELADAGVSASGAAAPAIDPRRVHADDRAGDAGGTFTSRAPTFVGAARRICFFSLNGGVGRTTLATEIACVLAARGRHRPHPNGPEQALRVTLVDLDLRSSNVSVRLGIAQPTLWDHLLATGAGAGDVSRFMVTHPSGLRALLGPPKPLSTVMSAMEPVRVAEILDQVERDGSHFIVMDLSGDLGEVTTSALSAAHDIYVVITATAGGLQDAYRTTEALRRLGLGHKLRYVVNRARGRLDVGEVMGDLGGRVTATIPWDARLEDAENHHRIASLSGGGPAAEAIFALAATIYPSLAVNRRRRFRPGWRRHVL